MVEREVKEKLFALFGQWMRGQTVSEGPNGETIYYDWDVQKFLDQVERKIVKPYAGIND